MQYKLILLDVDGTLYSHTTKSIPESTIKALKMVQEKGIKIGIASGRSKIVTAFTGILDILDFDFFVTTNGNLVIEGTQEIRVSYEVRQLYMRGIIRRADISSDNSIESSKIAELRVSYGGQGVISDVQQPRYGRQVLDIVAPF